MEEKRQLQPLILREEKFYLLTYGICFFSLGVGMASLGTMLPYLAENFEVTLSQISFLFTVNSLGYLVGSTGGGRLFDRFRGHGLMIVATLLVVSMSILIPLIPTYSLLLVLMALFSLGQGVVDIGGNLSLLWIFQSRASHIMNAVHFYFGLGAFLSPIVINLVMRVSGKGLTAPYWVLAGLYLPGIIGLSLLKSPNNPEIVSEGQPSERTDLRFVLLMMALLFFYIGLEAGFGGWIFTYALEEKIFSDSAASYINALFWGAYTIGRLISIVVAKRLTPRKLLIGNFALAILFLGLIVTWPRNPRVLWIGTGGLGFALSSVFPTLLALVESHIRVTGRVTGLLFLGSSLGGMLLPMLIGQIFEFLGSYPMMITFFSLAVLGLMILLLVIKASERVGEKIRI